MKKIIAAIFMLLMLASTALAYNVDWQINTNVPGGRRSYECVGNVCEIGSVNMLQEVYGTSGTLSFSGSGNPDYYALFLWPEDECHVPTMFHIELDSSHNWASPYEFKQRDASLCGSNIESETISAHQVEINETVYYGAYLQTAFNNPDPVVNFFPADLAPYFDSKVNVKFYVNDVLQEERQVIVPFADVWLWQQFEFTPTEAGEYTLMIKTDMNDDCKCDGSNTKYVSETITVPNHEIPEFSGLAAFGLVAAIAGFVFLKRKE